MEKDFNPTRKDLLMIDELIIGIKNKKAQYVARKISLENSLAQLSDRYRIVRPNSKDFHRIKNTRTSVKEHLAGIELKIKGFNEELSYKNKLRLEIEFYVKHNKAIESKEDVDKILTRVIALKKKYSDFTKDRTRIASLRIMASEFITELESLLK